MTWEEIHKNSKEQVTREILAVMSGFPTTMQLRLHEYKTATLDGAGLLETLNFDEAELAHIIAALSTPDEVMRKSGKDVFERRVAELADCHAEIEANEAEKRNRLYAEMEA